MGWSWGAWLGYLFTARYPALVQKLILVGCPPLEDRYVAQIQSTRLNRLTKDQRSELEEITVALDDPSTKNPDALLDRLKHRCITIKIDGPSLRAPSKQKDPK